MEKLKEKNDEFLIEKLRWKLFEEIAKLVGKLKEKVLKTWKCAIKLWFFKESLNSMTFLISVEF